MAAIGRGLSCVLSIALPLVGLTACGGGGGGDGGGGVGAPTIASADPGGSSGGGGSGGGGSGGGGSGGGGSGGGGSGGSGSGPTAGASSSSSSSGSQSNGNSSSTGASGGSGGSASSSSNSALFGATLAALRGKGLETSSPDPSNGAWRVDGGGNDASLTIASDGNSRGLTLPDGRTANLVGGATNSDGSRSFTGTTNGSQVTMVSWGGAKNLHYTDYGTWAVAPQGGGQANQYAVYAVGLPTAAGQMPTTGSASYSGGTAGYAFVSGAGYAFKGDASMNADFGHGTITGQMTNLQTTALAGGAGGSMNDIALAGSITGSAISGTATPGSPTGKSVNIGATSGTFGGSFNGPAAQEVSGTYKMSGGGDSVLGSFGAHQ